MLVLAMEFSRGDRADGQRRAADPRRRTGAALPEAHAALPENGTEVAQASSVPATPRDQISRPMTGRRSRIASDQLGVLETKIGPSRYSLERR